MQLKVSIKRYRLVLDARFGEAGLASLAKNCMRAPCRDAQH